MIVYIPTYGRAERQRTWSRLPKSIQDRTLLVVQHREKHLYENYPTAVLPKKIETIAPTRQYIVQTLHDAGLFGNKLIMLDDDLDFMTRRTDDPGKFIPGKPKDIEKLFRDIEKKLDTYAHVGVASREGGNRLPKPFYECMRMTRMLAYDVSVLQREKVRFDRFPVQEDFDVTLQLLRKGYKNCVLTNVVHGQLTSGMAGGCSHFRTLELHNENAVALARAHDPFVKVVEKTTKTAWGGATRKDVMVFWKKAYLESVK